MEEVLPVDVKFNEQQEEIDHLILWACEGDSKKVRPGRHIDLEVNL